MGVRIILFVVLCVSFTLAEQTIFTNEEVSELFKTALNRFKKFSERGNTAVPNVPTFTRHVIQGKQMKLDYMIIDELKVYEVIVPNEFVVEQSQLVQLKAVFQEKTKDILPLIHEIEVTQPKDTRSRVSLKWPQGRTFNNFYKFTFSFPVISDYLVPVPMPNINLRPPEIIQVVRAAFDSFKEFTENGNQLGDSRRPYSFFKIQNYDFQLSYIIEDTVKIFTAEAHDKFLVKEADFSLVKNVLETQKNSMPGSSIIDVSPQLVNGHKWVFIRWTDSSNNYEFRLSFHVGSGHKSSLLLKLLAHLVH